MPIELKMPALSPTMEEGTLAKWLVKEGDDGQIGRHPRRDRDRQGDDGVRGGRRRQDRQDPGGRRHRRREGRGADRDHGGRGRRRCCRGQRLPRRPTAAQLASRRRAGRRPTRLRSRSAAAGAGRNAGRSARSPPPPPRGRGRAGQGLAARAQRSRRRRTSTSDHPGQRPRRAHRPRRPRQGRGRRRRRAGRCRCRSSALATHLVTPGPFEQEIPHEAVKLSNVRKTIARRLTESKQQVPHIYLTVDIQLDALLKLRARAQQGPREPRHQALRQRPDDQGARSWR